MSEIVDLPSETPHLHLVQLVGLTERAGQVVDFTDILYLQQVERRWYLILGRDRSGLHVDVPSTQLD